MAEASRMRVLNIRRPLAFSALPFRRKDPARGSLKEEVELSTRVTRRCNRNRRKVQPAVLLGNIGIKVENIRSLVV